MARHFFRNCHRLRRIALQRNPRPFCHLIRKWQTTREGGGEVRFHAFVYTATAILHIVQVQVDVFCVYTHIQRQQPHRSLTNHGRCSHPHTKPTHHLRSQHCLRNPQGQGLHPALWSCPVKKVSSGFAWTTFPQRYHHSRIGIHPSPDFRRPNLPAFRCFRENQPHDCPTGHSPACSNRCDTTAPAWLGPLQQGRLEAKPKNRIS